VKRCGKSAPRTRQRGRHGKPHREQDRIGITRPLAREARALRPSCPGWLLEASGNGRTRGMAATFVAQATGHTEPGLQADWHTLCERDPSHQLGRAVALTLRWFWVCGVSPPDPSHQLGRAVALWLRGFCVGGGAAWPLASARTRVCACASRFLCGRGCQARRISTDALVLLAAFFVLFADKAWLEQIWSSSWRAWLLTLRAALHIT
jgi:hypothetical protein